MSRRRLLAGAAAATAFAGCAAAAVAEPAPASPPLQSPAAAAKAAAPAPPKAEATTAASWLPGPIAEAYEGFYDSVVRPYADPSRDKLLPDHPPALKGKEKPTLVVSLDGTLIQSTWTRQFGWRYVKRPGVDEFLAQLAPLYELVLWTDAMNTADPVIDRLDPRRLFRHRLYRDTTTFSGGHHRKDLGFLNRDLKRVLIIDSSAEGYATHPEHGLCLTPYDADADPDKADTQLKKIVPFLQYLVLSRASDYPAELEAVRKGNASLNGDAVGAAFEARIAELRAAGKLPQLGARGARQGYAAAARGPSIWDRMRKKE